MDVLNGVADHAANQYVEPEDVEPQHEHRQNAEGPVKAALEVDAAYVKECDDVVEHEQAGDDEGADQRGSPIDAGVGDDAVNQSEQANQHRQ